MAQERDTSRQRHSGERVEGFIHPAQIPHSEAHLYLHQTERTAIQTKAQTEENTIVLLPTSELTGRYQNHPSTRTVCQSRRSSTVRPSSLSQSYKAQLGLKRRGLYAVSSSCCVVFSEDSFVCPNTHYVTAGSAFEGTSRWS